MGEPVIVLLVMIPILFLALLVGLAIWAIILRAAVSLYNKLAGGAESPGAVPEPSLLKAMGIVFVPWLVNAVLGLMIGAVLGIGGVAAGTPPGGAAAVAQLFSLPVSFLAMAAMLAALLPTTFGRAILVALCWLLVWVLVLGGIGIVAFVAFLVIAAAMA